MSEKHERPHKTFLLYTGKAHEQEGKHQTTIQRLIFTSLKFRKFHKFSAICEIYPTKMLLPQQISRAHLQFARNFSANNSKSAIRKNLDPQNLSAIRQYCQWQLAFPIGLAHSLLMLCMATVYTIVNACPSILHYCI